MASEFDDAAFVDGDFSSSRKTAAGGAATAGAGANRPPTREELEGQVSQTQLRLAELKRAQEELERERATLEEARRRQAEFQTGRQEMIQHLTRGVGLLETAEFGARSEAEQMAKTLAGLRAAATKVQSIQDAGWTQDTYPIELTRALTTIENARMEWNAARLKWSLLSGTAATDASATGKPTPANALLATRNFAELCKLGLALTWPLAAVALLAVLVLLGVLLRR